MRDQLEQLQKTAHAQIGAITSMQTLKEAQIHLLGKKSLLTSLREQLKQLNETERKEMGVLFNTVKDTIERTLANKQSELALQEYVGIEETERIDVTEPTVPSREKGHLHPNTIVQQELEDIALSMGFVVEDGPELDTDYYTFEALNIPKTHPARDAQDTFYIKDHPEWCMRSHVSNMQVRLLQKYGAPLRAAYPGRTFRNESTDASHEHTFYQFEALVVDRDITIGDLVGVIKSLLRGLFHKEIEVRLRPGYFPFVEPGFEMDMSCLLCGGKGCPVCKRSGWVELLGCGLMHPSVLREAGLDPREWNGLAFGMGLTRLVMMRYGIEDIRLLMTGDARFLKQF